MNPVDYGLIACSLKSKGAFRYLAVRTTKYTSIVLGLAFG